jgi:hypothetical protein
LKVACQRTLYISSGVTLRFMGDYSLNVYGSLKANGTEEEPILFTRDGDEGHWSGVHIFGNSYCSDNMTTYLRNVTIEYASACGGEDFWDHSGGALYIADDDNVELTNCIFRNNQAAGGELGSSFGGGALAILDCEPLIDGCQFIDNVCNTYGGAIGLVDASPLMKRVIIMDNTAGMLLEGGGAGIFMNGDCDPVMQNVTLLNNTTNGKGGGLLLVGGADPKFVNALIWGNTAAEGDQVYLDGNGCDPSFGFSDVMGGSGAFKGSGSGFAYTGKYYENVDTEPMCFHASGSKYPYELTKCSPIIDAGHPDEAYNDDDGTRSDMGAICFPHEGMYIQQADVKGSWDTEHSPVWINLDVNVPEGSSLVLEPGVEVVFLQGYKFEVYGSLVAAGEFNHKITFRPDSRDLGWSGIRFRPESSRGKGSQLSWCKITGAAPSGPVQADNLGGGVSIIGNDNVLVSFCEITGNQSGNLEGVYTGGGGIGILNCSPTIIHNRITNNYAPDFGGGIAIVNSSPTVHHNLVARNTSGFGGGGVSVSNSDPVINNLTIADNITYKIGGGLLISEDADPVIYNTIIWNNYADFGAQVYLNDSRSDPDFYYNDIMGGFTGIQGAGILSYQGEYENNIDLNPCFKNDRYGLLHGSPCIDAGDPDGRPDPDYTRADMGAFYYRTMDKDMTTGPASDDAEVRFRVFPLPTIDVLNIRGNNPYETDVELALYNALGQLVHSASCPKDESSGFSYEINVSNYQAGNYILVMKTGKQVFSRKVIIK